MTRVGGVDTNDLRVVVDAQIVLAMFLTRRDNPDAIPKKRGLLNLITLPSFHWLWTPEIISDYERGAEAIEEDEKITRRAHFDRAAFQLFLAALQLSPSVNTTATTLRDARRRISEAPRKSERDLDDAVYLACAVDGDANLLVSEDSDLHRLGTTYENVRIVNWRGLKNELTKRGLIEGLER